MIEFIISGVFSRDANIKAGFSVIDEFHYADYKDDQGNVIFPNTGVHKCISMMTQKIKYPGKDVTNAKIMI